MVKVSGDHEFQFQVGHKASKMTLGQSLLVVGNRQGEAISEILARKVWGVFQEVTGVKIGLGFFAPFFFFCAVRNSHSRNICIELSAVLKVVQKLT